MKEFHTGVHEIYARRRDLILLVVLVTIGLESLLYFCDFWFFTYHPRRMILFVVLSFAVCWGMFRNAISWVFYFFISLPHLSQNKKPIGRWSLDVLTTAMPGEPYEMFAETLAKIAAIRGPHTTYLLDGGNDSRLKTLCEKTGTIHVNCVGVGGAKAGKVNHCLTNFARGEIVLVIDPDHLPEADFFERVLPYFGQEDVGFVQVVQAYYNQNNSFVAMAAAEETYGFYGPLMMALNGMNIPFAIGANCTFRRRALDSIGGHAVGLAEDAQTSLRVHTAGWRSIYLPYRGSYGLVPEKLSSFFSQQLKWSYGMFRLLFEEYFASFRKLTASGRIYYFYAGTHYLLGFVTLINILLPVIFLFFKVFAVEMKLADFLVHLAPYLISGFAINMYIQRWYTCGKERRFPWRSMLLEKGTWHIYLQGMIYAIAGKKLAWLPTPKSSASGRSVGIVIPHGIAIALSFAAIAFALATYQRIDDGSILMMLFAAMNALALLPMFVLGIRRQKGL